MKKKYDSILLFSGGLDSYIAWHYLNHPPVIFLNARQSYFKKELNAVQKISQKHKDMELIVDNSLDLSSWEEPSHYIPYRNIFFSMVASLYSNKVYLVGIKGDLVDDNNPKATQLMSQFYRNFNHENEVVVTSPFYQMTKSEMVKWYLDKNLPIENLLLTRSCYGTNSSGQCGKCPSCFRRWVALENNGIKEKYDSPPWEWSEVKRYLTDMKRGVYDKDRTRETIQALSNYMNLDKIKI